MSETRSCDRCRNRIQTVLAPEGMSDRLDIWDIEQLMTSTIIDKLSKGCWGCDLELRYSCISLGILLEKLGVRI